VGQTDSGRGLALTRRRRRDRRDQDQLAVLLVLESLDVVAGHLGLVVAVRIEMLRRDAELFLGDVEDAPLGGGLGDFNIGLRRLVLRGGHEGGPSNEREMGRRNRRQGAGYVNLALTATLADFAHSPPSIFLPSAGCTRVTL